MATTVVDDLYEYNPVRNPVRYRVNGSNFDPGAPVRPLLGIAFNIADMPLNGDTITLNSTVLGGANVFNFVTSPGYNEDELPAYVSGTTSAYAVILVAALQAKYIIAANYIVLPFDFGGGNFGFVMLAINLNDEPPPALGEYSPDQDLTWSPGGWTEALDTTNNANSFVLPANAAIIFQVLADVDNPNGDYRLLLEEEYPPDNEGNVFTEDIGPVLRSVLSPTFPDPDNVAVVTAYDSFCNFFVRAAERYGDPIATYPMLTSSTVQAYLAGRNQINLAEYPNYEDQVIRIGTNIRFLTTWPNNDPNYPKQITPTQIEYLAWIFPSDRGNEWRLKADLYYETGADTLAHVLATIDNKNTHLLLCPVGVEQNALADVDPTRRLRAYRVYLTNTGSTVRSEYRYYTVDHRHHLFTNALTYWTPSGGLDTLLLHGAAEREADIDVQRSKRYVSEPTTSSEANDTVSMLQTTGEKVAQGTCYLKQAEIPALKDLFGSEDVRMLLGDEWVPVELLDKGDVDLAQDGAGLQSRTIKYRRAHTDRANL